MTAVQQLRLQGFHASLQQRGVLLRLLPAGPDFNALIEPLQPQAEQFTISEETRDFSIVHILRTELTAVSVKVGDSFEHTETNTVYRITRIENNPVDIAVKFHCETASAGAP